jgi:amino acid adenylation domain-containing protein
VRTELSSSQQELRRTLAAVLGAAATREQLQAQCAAHGWLAMTMDVRDGGLGLGETEAVLLAEQLGATQHGTDLIDQLIVRETAADPGLENGRPWRKWLRHSAYLVGLALRAIDLAVARARDRRQFGTPISQFQAVMFPLAENAIRLRGLQLRIYQLATQFDAQSGQPAEIPPLARLAEDIASRAISHAVHTHGASGLTDAADVSACYRLMLAVPAAPMAGPPSVQPPVPPSPDPAGYLRAALERRVSAGWAGTTVSYPGPACVHQLVAAAARRFPDVAAVQVVGEAVVTYRELEERANRLAHALRRRGVTADSVVAVCLPRSVDMIVAVLGVLKAGGAYLPVDPEYPPERLEFMITDSRAAVVVTQSWLTEWLPDSSAALLEIDMAAQQLSAEPADAPAETADAHSLAYVIYTSGSTGMPKGVEIEHCGLVNRLQWDRETFPLGPGDAVLQHTSLSFDIATLEIFGALVNGARLVLAPQDAERDTAALARVICAEDVTALLLVPSVLDVLLEEHPGLAEAKRLRYVFSGGEALSPELCRRVFDTVPQAELHNFYGPSEATIDVTSWHCTPGNIGGGVPIGRPLPNLRAYVVDDTGMPVAVGSFGELLVGGIGVARGYRFRPDLTRERFLPDPFSGESAARLYRTGDLVRYRQDGALEFLGRADEQVKVRGFRIEPAEIEAALEQLPMVRQAVVKAVGGARLDAYVTCFGVREPAPEDLLSALREQLPAHMVPGSVQILSAFPRMPNGKIDRAALVPSQVLAADDGDNDDAGAVGQVARLMADVLNRQGIAPQADFFALGGTSLQAARLVARLRNRFDADIDLGQFVEDPTCAGLARRVEASGLRETR